MITRTIRWYSLLLWLLSPLPGVGQSVWGGAGFIYGGQSVWPGFARSIHEVNKTAGSLDDRYRTIGAELYVRRNRLLLGAGASALVNKRVLDTVAQTTVESSASSAHIWAGWVIWQTSRAKLYPSLGLGMNSFNINSTTQAGPWTTHVLDGLSTDVGLTFDGLVLKASEDPRVHAGPMLSLRIGYRLATASNEWHGDRNGTTLVTAIRYHPYGFFVTLGVGGGGFRYK